MKYEKHPNRPVIRQSKILPLRVLYKAPRRFKTLLRLLALNEADRMPQRD